MPEPTIDEMLEWVDFVAGETYEGVPDEARAIRAILEQQRNPVGMMSQREMDMHKREVELAAIRAFVDRVEKRLPEYTTGREADSWLRAYRQAVYDELKAMEKEHGQTNS